MTLIKDPQNKEMPAELAAAVETARRCTEAADQAAQAARQAADALRAMLASIPGAAPAPALPSVTPIPEADLQIVIVAAVTAALRGRTFRINRIQLVDQPSLLWGQLGRIGIQSSHNVEKR